MNKQVEQIKAEIKRMYVEEHSTASTVLHKLIDFINSLPEEPVSEDLEKVAEKYANTDCNYLNELVTEYDGTEHWIDDKVFVEEAFKAGAQWKEQQMIDKAVKWLKANDIGYNYSESSYDHDDGKMIDDFRKAMSDNVK